MHVVDPEATANRLRNDSWLCRTFERHVVQPLTHISNKMLVFGPVLLNLLADVDTGPALVGHIASCAPTRSREGSAPMPNNFLARRRQAAETDPG